MKVPNTSQAKLAEKWKGGKRLHGRFLDFGFLHFDSVSHEMPAPTSPVYGEGHYENEVNKEGNVIEKERETED